MKNLTSQGRFRKKTRAYKDVGPWKNDAAKAAKEWANELGITKIPIHIYLIVWVYNNHSLSFRICLDIVYY